MIRARKWAGAAIWGTAQGSASATGCRAATASRHTAQDSMWSRAEIGELYYPALLVRQLVERLADLARLLTASKLEIGALGRDEALLVDLCVDDAAAVSDGAMAHGVDRAIAHAAQHPRAHAASGAVIAGSTAPQRQNASCTTSSARARWPHMRLASEKAASAWRS
jgi:hypothetical protein